MLIRQHGRTLTIQAPAKLNLTLQIERKREDGFHELETVMASISLYDTLRFTAAEREVSLHSRAAHSACDPRSLDPGPANLVHRAATLIKQQTGARQGASIDLFKRIPTAAGLGGGSSDAAATLVGLNRLWKAGLTRQALMRLAEQLGSDVPFFLAETPVAVCRGRGELVEPIALPARLFFVVARPQSGLSTAEVYRQCRPGSSHSAAGRLIDCLRAGAPWAAARQLRNDLQAPAERLNSDVRRLRVILESQPVLGHQLSGSGTACFGWCRNRRQARAVAARLHAARTGRVFVAESRP